MFLLLMLAEARFGWALFAEIPNNDNSILAWILAIWLAYKAPFTRQKIFGTVRMKNVRVPKKLVRYGYI